MIRSFSISLVMLLIAGAALSVPAPARQLAQLQQGDLFADFRVQALYDGEADVLGARFIHGPSGFILDLLRIQSVPQAFMWVNTLPPDDQGEPHTLEHLLLGKGTRGRYVASLEDMSLGRSSAFTMQTRTCYHFNTSAGTDVFFNLFREKLKAMLHPNFTDEEIRREVCNMGIRLNPDDSSLDLEEKGTVYNEMVSSLERPWGDLYFELGHMLWGPAHPLSYSSGGLPSALRRMRPDDIRRFHAATYHLNNMGAIVAIPDDLSLDEILGRLSVILKDVEPDATPTGNPDDYQEQLPPPTLAPRGTIKTVSFPSQNESEPCLMVFAWPPERKLSPTGQALLQLFLEVLANGQTSDLYNLFINSQSKVMDIGATSSFGWVDSDPGAPVYVGFSNVRVDVATEPMIDSIRSVIMKDIQDIASYPDHSEELRRFNKRVLNRLVSLRKNLRDMLNSPPRFGYRGTGSSWMEYLLRLHKKGGFHRSLMLADDLADAERLLKKPENIWRQYVSKFHLLSTMPYGIATRPDATRISQSERARKQRIEAFIDKLEKEYDVTTRAAALARYKKEYDVNTARIDSEARSIEMPGFIDNPPLTLDDQLQYEIDSLPGGGPLVISTFDNMTSSSLGLAFNMYAIPESLLLYVPILPDLLTGSGLVKDGRVVPYDEMQEALRREILGMQARFATNPRTERVELVVRARASSTEETPLATRWLQDVLLHADLRSDNLQRIRDEVELALGAARNRMRGSEESWVNIPAGAYWKQRNHLYLSTACFLTQTNLLQRVRWQLKEPPENPEPILSFLKSLEELSGTISSKDELASVLNTLQAQSHPDSLSPAVQKLADQLPGFSGSDITLVHDVLKDLRLSLSDIPEQSLATDFEYLCRQIPRDLAVHPLDVLSRFSLMLELLRHQDNVRGFVVASRQNQEQILPVLNQLAGKLATTPTHRQTYQKTPQIISRLRHRLGETPSPVFVGLVNPSTRSGVHINSARCASFEDSGRQRLLKFLSARLYGGGGAHSMFMKTWGAGLAYSNGLRSNENTGRLIYYAERCPDLAQTMRFVVNQLENADYDPSLADYAVAQAFAVIRSGSRFESRGEAMAADLADGLTPEVVSRFRRSILKLRNTDHLYDTLLALMPSTYGEVLPGYGISAGDAAADDDAFYFVIGPDAQMQSYEKYLKSVEGPGTALYRLYPRDFWLVDESRSK